MTKILKTICAYGNNYYDNDIQYIFLGVEEVNDENNSFVDFTTVVKNISGSDIMASNIATVNLLDVNNNPYPATVVYEKDDHSNLEAASSLTLKNDQSAIIHYIFEVGDDVVNEAKSIRISRQGKVYIINI